MSTLYLDIRKIGIGEFVLLNFKFNFIYLFNEQNFIEEIEGVLTQTFKYSQINLQVFPNFYLTIHVYLKMMNFENNKNH